MLRHNIEQILALLLLRGLVVSVAFDVRCVVLFVLTTINVSNDPLRVTNVDRAQSTVDSTSEVITTFSSFLMTDFRNSMLKLKKLEGVLLKFASSFALISCCAFMCIFDCF